MDSHLDSNLDARLVRTDDGSLTLRHAEHGECYHSSLGARAEARMLYIERSGFREALAAPLPQPLHVLDVGLGLGYNALATLSAWRAMENPRPLVLVSLEYDAELVRLLASGKAPWQREWSEADCAISSALVPTSNGFTADLTHPTAPVHAHWIVLVGDAQITIEGLETPFAFIWQDPFSPERNPTLWNGAWFQQLRRVAHAECTLATYSVARTVKDALESSGWAWRRIETGIPRKRHWLLAAPAP